MQTLATTLARRHHTMHYNTTTDGRQSRPKTKKLVYSICMFGFYRAKSDQYHFTAGEGGKERETNGERENQ